MIKQEVKTEVNAKNINELFSTFLSENEESGQGTSGNRVQENGNFQKTPNLPVLFKIERGIACADDDVLIKQQQQQQSLSQQQHASKYLNNAVISAGIENDELAIATAGNRVQHNAVAAAAAAAFQKDPILISFDNTTLTAKAVDTKSDPNRYVQAAAATISSIHTPFQNETFIRSFFNAMAMQVEQANLNFQAWATIQQEVMEVVNRNIIQSIQQQSNRFTTICAQTQTANGTS